MENKKKQLNGNLFVKIVIVTLILAGFLMMIYPTFSDRYNRLHQSEAVAKYVEQISDTSGEEAKRLLSSADKYNEEFRNKPDRFHLTDEEKKIYKNTLDVTGTGIMGYISVPKMKIEYPVYHGTDEGVLQIAIGHLDCTSLPTGGIGNHSAVSGHRGLPSARLFTDIDKLKVGDRFSYTILNRRIVYEIREIVIVEPDDMAPLELDKGKDLSTLITCTPYGVNSHRLMITGEAIKIETINPKVQKEEARNTRNSYRKNLIIFLSLLAAVLLFIFFIIYFAFLKNRNK